jgi:hypothetical protein
MQESPRQRRLLSAAVVLALAAVTVAPAVVAQSPSPSPSPSVQLTLESDLCVTVASGDGVDVSSADGLQQALLEGSARITDVRPCPEPVAEPTPEPTASPAPRERARATGFRRIAGRAWAKLVKSPDKHTGRRYRVWACISQFDAATGPDMFRGQASYRKERYWWSEGENAFFMGDEAQLEDFVADDIVAMGVVSLGSYSYDTQAGGNTTVPLFQVVTIKRERGSC